MEGCVEFVKGSEIVELIYEPGVYFLYNILLYKLITTNKNYLLKKAKVQRPYYTLQTLGVRGGNTH